MAAEGGGDHRGDPGDHTENQKLTQFDIRKAHKVGQQVLGGARDKIQQEDQVVAFTLSVEKPQLINPLPGHKNLHQLHAVTAGKRKYQTGCQTHTHIADGSAHPGAKGIPSGSLQKLTGDQGDKHL